MRQKHMRTKSRLDQSSLNQKYLRLRQEYVLRSERLTSGEILAPILDGDADRKTYLTGLNRSRAKPTET